MKPHKRTRPTLRALMEIAAQRDAATNEATFAAKQVEIRDKMIDELQRTVDNERLRAELSERRLEEVNDYLQTVLSLLGLRSVGAVDRIAALQFQVRQRGHR